MLIKNVKKVKKEEDLLKKPKKQNLKKLQKTAELNAAKKLAKLKAKKAISRKLIDAPFVKRQRAKHQFDPIKWNHGVLLLKNLPHGFYEKQLKKYFSQYGDVTRLRLARSERTGRSKGFAYIEFQYPDVAKIAAESMNNYIMFRQCLKAVYIPPEKQDHDYFKQTVVVKPTADGLRKLETPKIIRAQQHVNMINAPVSAEKLADRTERSQYKLKFLEKKLAKAGINIDLSSQLYSNGANDKVDISSKSNVKNGKQSKKETLKGKEKHEQINPSKKNQRDISNNTASKNPPQKTAAISKDVVNAKQSNKLKATVEQVAKNALKKADPKLSKDVKKATVKNAANTTLENLLENTINTSDEESSDDNDYEPTPEELADADRFVEQFLNMESSDDENNENDTTLNRFLNNTIESRDGESDDDYKPNKIEIKKFNAVKKANKAAKKLVKMNKDENNENDTTLNRLLNNTIESQDGESDDDYEPNETEIKKFNAAKKANKAGKQLAKVSKVGNNDTDTKKVSLKDNANKQQNKRKVSAEQSIEVPAKKIKNIKKEIANKSSVAMDATNKIKGNKKLKSNSNNTNATSLKAIAKEKKLVINPAALKMKLKDSNTNSAKAKENKIKKKTESPTSKKPTKKLQINPAKKAVEAKLIKKMKSSKK